MQVDPDKAFAVQIKHEESVLTGNVAYMQCAVLFSSSNGERRIRCFDMFSSQCIDIFSSFSPDMHTIVFTHGQERTSVPWAV